MRIGPFLVVAGAVCLLALGDRLVLADPVTARAPDLAPGITWTMLETREGAALPLLEAGWESRTFWDLRPFAAAGRRVTWSVLTPAAAGLGAAAQEMGADRALCASLPDGGDEHT